MAIKKQKTPGSYTTVSNLIVRDVNLSLIERGLMLTLLSFPADWTLTVKGLCSILPDGKDRITRALNKLIEKGYVTRVQKRSEEGKFAEIVLEVNSTPYIKGKGEATPDQDIPDMANSDADNPDADNPDADNPDADNRTQYYNQESKNEKSIKYTSTKADDVDDKSNKNNSESYEQVKELLEPYGLSQRDIHTLFNTAGGSVNTIKQATDVLDVQTSHIHSVTGWLIDAINNGYTTPIPRKPPLKANGIRFELERDHDYDDLERIFVKNYRHPVS